VHAAYSRGASGVALHMCDACEGCECENYWWLASVAQAAGCRVRQKVFSLDMLDACPLREQSLWMPYFRGPFCFVCKLGDTSTKCGLMKVQQVVCCRDARPLHGYVPAFDPRSAPGDAVNTVPLQQWLSAAPWAQLATWRRVPVIIKVMHTSLGMCRERVLGSDIRVYTRICHIR
jgi:hypothetical protein